MTRKPFGDPVSREFTTLVSSVQQPDAPELNWEISDEARAEIEKLEENVRISEQRSGTLLLG